MASIRRASPLSSTSSFLLVTITLVMVVLTICGEIQTVAAAAANSEDAVESATVQDRSNGKLLAPRTFGRLRMMKNVMLPLMFLLGGIKTLLIFLVAIALKTLFVAMTIFVINISVGLAKVINFFKHGIGGHHHKDLWSSGPDKNIHIHIHSDPSHHLSLDGPVPPLASVHSSVSPTIHSGVFPYSRSDVIEPIYTAPGHINSYSKMYALPTALTNARPQSLPYSGWQHTTQKR